MRKFVLCLAFAGVAAKAQQPAAEKLFGSAADVNALITKAKSERKNQPNIPQMIVRLAPYNVNVEYARRWETPASTCTRPR